jgi:hypothetical protein
LLNSILIPQQDSETALDIADGTAINHRKNQHIDIKYHAICHYIQQKKVVVNHTPSSESIADLFTKALGPQKHQRLVDYMGMRNCHEYWNKEEVFSTICCSYALQRVPHNRLQI